MAHKEIKLTELRNKLSRMDQQKRQPQHPSIQSKTKPALSSMEVNAQTLAHYIAYPKALKALAECWNATPEELAAWIFMGPELGGLTAYTNANEFNPPPRFYYGSHTGTENYITLLMACWFKEDDIANFQPIERYITGDALIKRWSNQSGIKPIAFISAKIAESRLMDIHPTFGGTKATFSEMESFPPLETGLFSMSHITAIEENDFGLTQCNKPKIKAPQTFVSALKKLLEEIERRASIKGDDINRRSLPGTKGNLQTVASKFDTCLDGFSPQTFDDYLVGVCQFKKGRPPTNTKNPYAELFPEFF